MDTLTKRWILNAADERAVANGCRFDEKRGQKVVSFFERFLHLYEGEFAGQRFVPQDWQADLLMRCFGWVRPSDHWQRDVRRFRKASIFVPKKNGKSPLGAGVGLYLLTGDGEQGQKVFSAARDGVQARIMHEHAMRMVQLSPSLSKHCKINKSTGRIAFLPTASTYSILAGDNINSQEGLNGSVVIDEIHVVSSQLASVLEHMGASRAESLQFEISTAGNNPEGYGRKQYEYGKSVERGDFHDDQFLFVAYEAPQDCTDEDIETKPEIWQAANPSWGVTINEEEFRSSLNRAKRSLTDWSNFCMYRLNRWQASANPWLKQDDWSKCARNFSADDLQGMPCWLGLDLSKTRDLTAAVLVFPDADGETFWQLPYFFLPEEEAKAKNHLAPFLEWANDGYLELTPGNVLDYRHVLRRIAELSKQFDIQGVAYDKTYAEELTQTLEEEHGIERFVFEQSWRNFASGTADYERLVIGGKFFHPNHPLLSWQANHCEVKTDSNLNKRPVKPPHNSIKKIDGVVAGIMALSAAIARPATHSVYDQKGAVLAL
ncbi:terminase large subunit [Anatilimnocola floriformis]|uniref:terminase large subunit n=1 Tax=Anatilimnocola floriformis TaxID=2948575 RepID=UPI0020C4D7FB|nr:terminase TerL endonuclease subunit [Anatilimnocola floriformis]